MIAEVYEALLEAGASQDKARKAAESIAAYDSRFSKIEADLLLIKWMVGFNLAFSIAMISMVVKSLIS